MTEIFTPTVTPQKPVPSPGAGVPASGGTFTPQGFVPNKPKVKMPTDQAPYRHGRSPNQRRVKALKATGEVQVVDQGPSHSDTQRAAQTMATQRMLNARGAHLAVDGVWGAQTEAAYQAYLHHTAQRAETSRKLDASQNPLFQHVPTPQEVHEQMVMTREARIRALQPRLEAAQTRFSTARRAQPHYNGEPVAGYTSVSRREPGAKLIAVGRAGEKWALPYYTDAHTHQTTRGQVAATADQSQFEAMFGPQTEADLEQANKIANPTAQAVIGGIGGSLPGVDIGQRLAQGKPVGPSNLAKSAGNALLWLGPAEVAAPFKLTKGIIQAARTGQDLKAAARGAVALWREGRLAKAEAPIIARNLADSPDRQAFIQAVSQAPNLSGTEQHALLQVADHNAVMRASATGERPSIAWGKANFGQSTYHDVAPTTAEAGAIAQTGDFQRAPLTTFPGESAWNDPKLLKQVNRLSFTGPNGDPVSVPFVSKLHSLVFEMPEKVGVQELLGKMKSAGIKDDEIRWNRFDTFLAEASGKGQKSITREEALGWLDKNYLKIEENRRDMPRGTDYGSAGNDPNASETKFDTYTIPGGKESNYQEFTIRLPEDQYGGLFQYMQHFPDSNILAHVRTTDRAINDEKTLMIEEIQSDWYQAAQKQGFKLPITEHPDYPARMEALGQAEQDVTSITWTLRRRIVDGLMQVEGAPAIPDNLRAAFERGGEQHLGINATDSTGLRDWAAQARQAAEQQAVNPEARAEVQPIHEQMHHGGVLTGEAVGAEVVIHSGGGESAYGRWFNNQFEHDYAQRASEERAQQINNFLSLRPADQASVIDTVDALRSALLDRLEKQSLLQALERDASRGVAQGPFAKTWHELAFKRMLAEAVDKGYDRVAWTTGKTQAERYQLGNFFQRIEIRQGSEYSGNHSDALYEWATEMAQNSVGEMDAEQLGLDSHLKEQLRERAHDYSGESYPQEEHYYYDDNGENVDPSTPGATFDQGAHNDAMDSYTQAVDDAYAELEGEWLDEARQAQVESETEYFMDNASEYGGPTEGNLVVNAQDHQGYWHDYNASTDSGEDNYLENVVGSDVARAYLEDGKTDFEGENLVAGENAKSALGASHFYDNKLTGFVNKYLKKTGVQSTKEELGGTPAPFQYRIDFLPGQQGQHGNFHLTGHGVDRVYGNFFEALNEQHRLFGDIPKATVEGGSDDSLGRFWVHWSDFPKGAPEPSGLDNYVEGFGRTSWGPFRSRDEAATETEDLLINKFARSAPSAGAGIVVHSIPVTDEVRAFVDQGLALFQRDPLVKQIGQRVKGAVKLGGEQGAALHLFQGADVSTVVHELGHVVQREIPAMADLSPEEFARSFEQYFLHAQAPTEHLRPAYDEIANGLRRVYADGKIPEANLTPEMHAALDRFFSTVQREHPQAYGKLASVALQHEDFHVAARNELDAHAALARDVARTLPEGEWPAWVRNQIREQAVGPEKPGFTWPNPPSPMDRPNGHLTGLPKGRVSNSNAQQIARDYMTNSGLAYHPPLDYVKVDPERARRIAAWYDGAVSAPHDPAVLASYDAMIRETKAQYDAMTKAGYRFEFYPSADPYPLGPSQAIEDLRRNKHLFVFPTSEGFGALDAAQQAHPLLADSGIQWGGKQVTHNDLFRAVHDFMGHFKEGVGFRADGEENAWRAHVAMFSDQAKPAMTSETRGQNSWVNFGPHGEANKTADQLATTYADQKAVLAPEWVVKDGAGGGRNATYFQEETPPGDFFPGEEQPFTDETLARTYGHVPELSPEQQVREGVKGARSVYGKQKAARSEELRLRAQEVDKALRSIADPDEAMAAAAAAMRGELPKIDFQGLTTLDAAALKHLKSFVNQHDSLLPFQKIRLNKALDAAVNDNKVPTPSEMRLIEHVFGKKTAIGIAQQSASWGDKIINALNIPRTIMASFDLSAAGRQALVAGASHPVIWGRAWPTMLKSMRSADFYEESMQAIKDDPLYHLALAGRVSFTDLGSHTILAAHEEQFGSDYAAQLPGLGHVIKGSARAYTSFLNKVRMDLFKNQIRIALAAGRDVQDEELLHDIGDVINAATGRGTIHGRAEHILPALNTLLFSPRLMLSRLNYLDPTWYVRLGPQARREALRGLFATAGAVSGIIYLASRIPGVEIGSLDPRSADFGKLKLGNTRIDVAGGFQQYIRLASELATNTSVSSTTGIKRKLGSGFGVPTRLDVLQSFVYNKLAPAGSIFVNVVRGHDAVGNKTTPQSIAESNFAPLILQDAKDIYNEKHGGMNGIALALAGFGVEAPGFGLQTYAPKDAAKKPTDKLTSEAKKAGMPVPDARILIDVKHKAALDGLTQQHKNDPQGRLDSFLKYYATTTGDHQYDRWIGAKLSDSDAEKGAEQIRTAMVGAGLSQYEANIKASLAAQGKKW